MKLSAAGVEKIKPTDKRQEIPDSLCVGLYLIVQPTGKKGWQVRYRHGGVHRRMSLGAFPVLSLAGAASGRGRPWPRRAPAPIRRPRSRPRRLRSSTAIAIRSRP